METHAWAENPQVPIAITGMACRLPQAVTDLREFWDLMDSSRTAYSDVPTSRFRENAFYHPDSEKNGTVSGLGI